MDAAPAVVRTCKRNEVLELSNYQWTLYDGDTCVPSADFVASLEMSSRLPLATFYTYRYLIGVVNRSFLYLWT